jgi:hypothetical protein
MDASRFGLIALQLLLLKISNEILQIASNVFSCAPTHAPKKREYF